MKTTTNPRIKLTKIDDQFIDELKKEWGSIHWNFEVEEKQIVPAELTHDELMRNNGIDKSVYKYYFLPTSKMLTEKAHGGTKDFPLTPYPFSINGAYHSRTDLVTKLSRLNCTDEKPYLNGNNNLENFEDLTPYFKEYAEGFENGYNEFEDKCIKPFLPMFPDKQDFITKVFEYLTDRRFFHRDWLNNHINGFVVYHHNGPEGGNIENGFEDGQKQGYFYKAWGIVFSNNALFAPLFENQKTTSSPQQNTAEFKNNFDSVDRMEVYNHFKTGLAKYLTEEELKNFLIQAFEKKHPPSTRFKLTGVETKKAVIKVFYQYYSNVAVKPYGEQRKYAGLLGDYFEGFKTENVRSNFSKSTY